MNANPRSEKISLFVKLLLIPYGYANIADIYVYELL